MAGRIELSQGEALRFNPNWSDADRLVIREQLERLEAAGFYTTMSLTYVRVLDAEDEHLMWLQKGRIDFMTSTAPQHAALHSHDDYSYGSHFLALTTFSGPEVRAQGSLRTRSKKV